MRSLAGVSSDSSLAVMYQWLNIFSAIAVYGEKINLKVNWDLMMEHFVDNIKDS